MDTAGRLHTRVNLMAELDKIRAHRRPRSAGRPARGAARARRDRRTERADAGARVHGAAGVTGIVLTKLDGTAKGGVAVAIAHDLKLPIRYVGVGEAIDDLVPFSPEEYVDALFEESGDGDRRSACSCAQGAGAQPSAGRGRTSPNPMVGALVVDDDGVIVGRGAHEIARRSARGESSRSTRRASGRAAATLYCTLEPCSHTGRTGPCAPRIAEAGIRRAVIAIEDPNPLVQGRGLAHLRDRGIDVTVGVRAGRRGAAERRRSSPRCAAGGRT